MLWQSNMILFWCCVCSLVESQNAVSDTCMLCASVFFSSSIFMSNIFKIWTMQSQEKAKIALVNTSVAVEFLGPKERADQFNTINQHIPRRQCISSVTEILHVLPAVIFFCICTPCFL